jgi:hypothetical protein
MKTATGLTLIAVGAVLAFAVHGHPWFLNLQVCGWIIMVIGAIGLAIPRRGYGWLRRQMVTRRGPDGQPVIGIQQKRYPPYIMINPAAAAAAGVDGADGFTETAEMPEMPASSEAESWAGADGVVADGGRVVADEEVVEEFFPE